MQDSMTYVDDLWPERTVWPLIAVAAAAKSGFIFLQKPHPANGDSDGRQGRQKEYWPSARSIPVKTG